MGKGKYSKPAKQAEPETKAAETEAAVQETPAAEPRKKLNWMLRPRSGKALALHIVLDLAVPYAYLMLCGLVFDKWLRLYNWTPFVFFSYAALQLAGIVLAVLCIVNYRKYKKGK